MHTKEPWKLIDVIGSSVIHAGSREVLAYRSSPDAENKANARRIVACVNALAHISTEELETGNMQNLIIRMRDAEQRRDEILAALKATKTTLERENESAHSPICDTIWHTKTETLFDYIDEAIAKSDLTQ